MRDPKNRVLRIRVNDKQYAAWNRRADAAGMSVGAFLRTIADGSPGPRAVRRAPVARRELARLLGEFGKIGSNVNQIAKAFNSIGAVPAAPELTAMIADIAAMRSALMTALGRAP